MMSSGPWKIWCTAVLLLYFYLKQHSFPSTTLNGVVSLLVLKGKSWVVIVGISLDFGTVDHFAPKSRTLREGYRQKNILEYDPWDIKHGGNSKESGHLDLNIYRGTTDPGC